MIDTVFILKFLKFCVVGLCGMCIDFSFTWLLKEKAKINSYIANSCGFILAASSNYLLNRWWTFSSNNPQIAREYFSFFAISLLGLGLNNLTIWILSEKYRLNFYFSKLIAIGLVTIWNFSMNFLFTFV
ncbi:MAG: GtrA family protein [Dysgonamonadaceae bacterium]|jgi:putative flippase GtrA|nr:GtrA family protein [Dysgonamonadaceae bacterium]